MINEYTQQIYPSVNREYKDRLFRIVFQKKEYLLELYNAINGTDYQNPEDLQVNTLENVIYISMKNDISFLLGGTMNLYEHQSSYNPNMPIRGLMYFGKLYDKYITANHINIFSSALKPLPVPQYFVFYNGTKNEPDQTVLQLTDAFTLASNAKQSCLECTATMLNINYGHNQALMDKCQRLEEYALFVASVRLHLKAGITRETAVKSAIDECIDRNILKDILTDQKSEVIAMVLETFNQEDYEQDVQENGIRILIKTHQKYNLSRDTSKNELITEYNLFPEKAEEYLQKYWKE